MFVYFSLGGIAYTMKTTPSATTLTAALIGLVRYIAAVVVAFITSLVSVGACSPFLIGFSGVFCGSLCLRRRDRLFGSLLLLVLGLTFYGLTIGLAGISRGEGFPFYGFIRIGIGGLIAVAYSYWSYWRQPHNTALEPTDAAPLISDEPVNQKAGNESENGAND